MCGLFGKGDTTENNDARKSQGETMATGEEIPEEVLREIVGGADAVGISSVSEF